MLHLMGIDHEKLTYRYAGPGLSTDGCLGAGDYRVKRRVRCADRIHGNGASADLLR